MIIKGEIVPMYQILLTEEEVGKLLVALNCVPSCSKIPNQSFMEKLYFDLNKVVMEQREKSNGG